MPATPSVLSVAITPKTRADREKLETALAELAQLDPSFEVRTDATSGQTILDGTSELHLETLVERMMSEYKLEVNIGKPQVIYRESIRAQAEAEGRYIRQTRSLHNYGQARIRIEPNDAGKGYEFSNDIQGGVIPQEYIEPINQSIQATMAGGILAGYEMIDIKVILCDGSYHDVDSSEMAFKIAASMAFIEAARKAKPVLLEPVISVAVTVPEQYTGSILADLNTRRGSIDGMEMVRGFQTIRAVAPLSTIVGDATAAGGITQGLADVSIRFLRYQSAFGGAEPGGEGPAVAVGNLGSPRPRSGSSYARLDAE